MNTTTHASSGRKAASPSYNNKATGVGHKPRAAGASPGAAPLEPQTDMSDTKRRFVFKVRFKKQEMDELYQMVPANGKGRRGISRFIRERVFSPHRNPSADSAKYRLLAQIKNSMQQIARQANSIEDPHTVVEVLARLASLDREIKRLAADAIKETGQ